MTAFIAVELCLGGFPAGIPDGIAILYIEVFAVDVTWYIVVTITCKSQQFCIFIESIAAAGVGNQ